MALQPNLIACGWRATGISMGVRFLAGPAVMTAASLAIGLRGTLLRIAIVQVTTISALRIGMVAVVVKSEFSSCQIESLIQLDEVVSRLTNCALYLVHGRLMCQVELLAHINTKLGSLFFYLLGHQHFRRHVF